MKAKFMKSTIAIVAIFLATSFAARAADDVAALWKTHCFSCHGADGKGKTKAGRMAKVKDFTDAEYQKSFKDEDALKKMIDGIKEDGKDRMKPFKDKLSEGELKSLLAFIRTLNK